MTKKVIQKVQKPKGYQDLKYAYLRPYAGPNEATPVLCIGYTVEDKEIIDGSKVICFAISLCSPNDTFTRIKAYEPIVGRYNGGAVGFIQLEDTSHGSVSRAIGNAFASEVELHKDDIKKLNYKFANFRVPLWAPDYFSKDLGFQPKK